MVRCSVPPSRSDWILSDSAFQQSEASRLALRPPPSIRRGAGRDQRPAQSRGRRAAGQHHDGSLWADAIGIVDAHVAAPWVTCVSRFDEPRAAALREAGLELRSTYWARTIAGWSTDTSLDVGPQPVTLAGRTAHTFGGAPFDPRVPGALTIAAADGGYVIGSAGVEPPLYDPGGPSCVVDRIIGPDRASLLDAAMALGAGRGDAAMVVVSDAADQAFAGAAHACGLPI